MSRISAKVFFMDVGQAGCVVTLSDQIKEQACGFAALRLAVLQGVLEVCEV